MTKQQKKRKYRKELKELEVACKKWNRSFSLYQSVFGKRATK